MSDVLTRPAPPPDGTVAYGPDPDQVIDLWRPRGAGSGGGAGGGPAPLVVFVHGGFWKAAYDRAHARPLANALAAAGYAVALPEYRRVGSAGGGGWRGTFDDVAAAFDAIPAIAAGYGADPGRAVWVGHSAGGHLALWAAARGNLPVDAPWYSAAAPAPVVSLAGCCCLELSVAWGEGGGAAVALLGGRPGQVPGRYALADPGALLPPRAPVTLLHGVLDQEVRPQMSRSYAERARAAGGAVTLVELPGVEHYGLIDPASSVWPQVVAAVRAALALI